MKEIYNAIEALGKYLGLDSAAVIILLVMPLGLVYLRLKYYQDVLKTGGGLAGVRERLAAHGGWRKAYFGHLRRSLAWVDKGLGPSAWSADSYEFTLTMAFIYPFASLLIVWIVTGQNTSGISDLLSEEVPLWHRALSVANVSASVLVLWRGIIAKDLYYLTAGIAFSVPSFLALRDAVGFVGSSLIVCVYAFMLALAYPGAIAAAVTFLGAFVAVNSAIATKVVAFAALLALAAVVYKIYHTTKRLGLRSSFYLLFLATMISLLIISSAHPRWFASRGEKASLILVFFVLLPLTNSVFDWLSLASTRWLLNGMAEREGASALLVAGNAITGLVLGVLLLAGLAVAITAALQTMNLLSQGNNGPELFDLAGTLHRLRTNPSDVSVWWVYFTLFSTMLPTVFHATVASASFVTWRLPDSWQKHWLSLIDTGNIKDDHRLLVGMSWRLTGIDVLTVVLAAVSAAVLAWILLWLMPHEGRDLLWLCEIVAEWLGAPITV